VNAFHVAKARLLRGWTQEEAARAIAPYLGTLLSPASFSAIERSLEVQRGRPRSHDQGDRWPTSGGRISPLGTLGGRAASAGLADNHPHRRMRD